MTIKSEKQKMMDGELYMASDAELSETESARKKTRLFNQTTEIEQHTPKAVKGTIGIDR